MFDENDGFFDHMPPLPPSPVDGGWAGVSRSTPKASTTGTRHRVTKSTISPNCAGARTVWDRACPCT